jgi:transcriptional regulator with XRE-family HTH domain
MDLTWGAWLRLARKGRGWTQVELGRAAGICAEHIADYEHDRRYPTPRTLLKLSAAFGLDLPTLAPIPLLRASHRAGARGQGGRRA